MYNAYICTGIEWKSSINFLPNLMSKHHIMGKPEARAQAVGILQAGSTHAEVAEAMEISLSMVKRWWKK